MPRCFDFERGCGSMSEKLKELGLFFALTGIFTLVFWLQFSLPSTGAFFFILGAFLIFLSKILDEREKQ